MDFEFVTKLIAFFGEYIQKIIKMFFQTKDWFEDTKDSFEEE